MTVGTPRRYYLGKRQLAIADCSSLVDVWQAKQEAEDGEALPSDFPSLTVLETKGYTTYEDLDGADVCELRGQGFNQREAEAILAAAAE